MRTTSVTPRQAGGRGGQHQARAREPADAPHPPPDEEEQDGVDGQGHVECHPGLDAEQGLDGQQGQGNPARGHQGPAVRDDRAALGTVEAAVRHRAGRDPVHVGLGRPVDGQGAHQDDPDPDQAELVGRRGEHRPADDQPVEVRRAPPVRVTRFR